MLIKTVKEINKTGDVMKTVSFINTCPSSATVYRFILMFAMFIAYSCTESRVFENGRDSDETEFKKNENEASPIEEIDRPQLSLLSNTLEKQFDVSVDFSRSRKSDKGPRVVELQLEYSSNLNYINHKKGGTLEKSDKQLHVQELENNQLRLVVFAIDNTNEIDTGRLATLTFKKLDGEKSTVRILTDSPIFAPAEANEGLLVSEPLTF